MAKGIAMLTILVFFSSCRNDGGDTTPGLRDIQLDLVNFTLNGDTQDSSDATLGDFNNEETETLFSSQQGEISIDFEFNSSNTDILDKISKLQVQTQLNSQNRSSVSLKLLDKDLEIKQFQLSGDYKARYSIDYQEDIGGTFTVRLVVHANQLTLKTFKSVFNSNLIDTTPPGQVGQWWKPALGQTWHIQYVDEILVSDRFEIYNIDLFDSSTEFIQSLKLQGKRVICYFSAGSYENWRPDEGDFPREVLGRGLVGWPGEKWLNTREREKLRPIMTSRLQMAKDKGCDGVDPDNVDGYINNTGFSLSYDDTLLYNRMLADIAHSLGLAIGLKNDVNQLEDLVDWYDFAVNESCFVYNECDGYRVFSAQGKPVYNIEYNGGPSNFCERAADIGMSSVAKNRNLNAWVSACF